MSTAEKAAAVINSDYEAAQAIKRFKNVGQPRQRLGTTCKGLKLTVTNNSQLWTWRKKEAGKQILTHLPGQNGSELMPFARAVNIMKLLTMTADDRAELSIAQLVQWLTDDKAKANAWNGSYLQKMRELRISLLEPYFTTPALALTETLFNEHLAVIKVMVSDATREKVRKLVLQTMEYFALTNVLQREQCPTIKKQQRPALPKITPHCFDALRLCPAWFFELVRLAIITGSPPYEVRQWTVDTPCPIAAATKWFELLRATALSRGCNFLFVSSSAMVEVLPKNTLESAFRKFSKQAGVTISAATLLAQYHNMNKAAAEQVQQLLTGALASE